MATKRRPPPTKQPSPTQPPAESSEDEEEDVESDSGKESEEKRSGKQSQSKALDDDDDSEEGDDSGEEDSESEPEQRTPNRPRSAAAAAAPTFPISATPAAASDDDEDDEGEESGESDSGTEPEQRTPNQPRPAAAAPTVPIPATPAAASNDEDDEGDESAESDSVTEEDQPVPNPPAPRSGTTVKPSNGDFAPESAKYAATLLETATGAGAAKKQFQRIWSDVDQTTLLKGMMDYIETAGKDPISNIEGFWLFIRKKLSFPVTEWQLLMKIRTVKRKFRINRGKNRAFSKAYDAEVFELSKKVWGAGEKSVAIERGGGKKRKGDELVAEVGAVEIGGNDEVEWENEAVNLSMKHIGLSEDLARSKIKSMAESERKLLVQSWKKVKADEVSSLLRRTALELETLKTIF